MNDLQKLQEWRRGGDARVLVTCHDASIRLIQWDDGLRSEADFENASDAVAALDQNRVYWQRRGRRGGAQRAQLLQGTYPRARRRPRAG